METRKERKPKNYWTLERLQEAAKQFTTKKAFIEGNAAAYSAAQKLNLLDVVCKDMIRLGSLSKRCIYAFVFTDNTAYIGLTYDVDRRFIQHTCEKGPVFNHIANHFYIGFEFKILYDYTDPETAAFLEKIAIEDYKLKGWKLLNSARAGGLGSNHRKWTEETCRQEALKYNCRFDFQREASGAYESARKGGFLNDISQHMEYIKRPNGFWTEETCRQEALKYNCRSDFHRKAEGAYQAALRGGFLNDISQHMEYHIKKPRGFWTEEACLQEALKYSSRLDFNRKAGGAYDAAQKGGFLQKICSHMPKRQPSK